MLPLLRCCSAFRVLNRLCLRAVLDPGCPLHHRGRVRDSALKHLVAFIRRARFSLDAHGLVPNLAKLRSHTRLSECPAGTAAPT